MNTNRTVRTITGLAVVAVLVAVSQAAGAWPTPTATSTPGSCSGATRTEPVTVTLTNLETGNPGSPGTPRVMSVFPNLTYTEFTPTVLANTGTEKATMTVDVPASFSGTVTVGWRMSWSGTDGHDLRDGSETVNVSQCVAPPTTATTVTTSPDTTTTAPTTTPSTTTPSTTVTTTTPATTTPTTTRPSTTLRPSATSTTPATTDWCDGVIVPGHPDTCAPAELEAPPATPVVTNARFTG